MKNILIRTLQLINLSQPIHLFRCVKFQAGFQLFFLSSDGPHSIVFILQGHIEFSIRNNLNQIRICLSNKMERSVIDELVDLFADHFELLKSEELSLVEVKEYYENLIHKRIDKTKLNQMKASGMDVKLLEFFVDEFNKYQYGEWDKVGVRKLFQQSFIEMNSDMISHMTFSDVHIDTEAVNGFLISVDGSSSSNNAVECAFRLRKPNDTVTIFHIHKVNKALPSELTVDTIRQMYSQQLHVNVPPGKHTLSIVECEEKYTIKTKLQSIVKLCATEKSRVSERVSMIGPHRPTFLFLGFSGRKSEFENMPSFMGSTTNIALRSWQLPVVISKSICALSHRVFLLAADCTKPNLRGLSMISCLFQPGDTLILVNVHSTSASTKRPVSVEDYYSELTTPLRSRIQVNHITAEREGGTVADCLLRVVNEDVHPDFVIVVPRARKHITSVTEEVILKSKSSIILCNNIV